MTRLRMRNRASRRALLPAFAWIGDAAGTGRGVAADAHRPTLGRQDDGGRVSADGRAR